MGKTDKTTNHAVDKQFALLERDLNFNYSVLPCLHAFAQISQIVPIIQHYKNNFEQPPPRTSPTEGQRSLIQQPGEPMLSIFKVTEDDCPHVLLAPLPA